MRPNKRDELVSKALKVFYRDGFHATGMDKLVVETGVSKTSMYKHFRTKEDLIVAALRLRDENFRNWFFQRIDEMAETPAEQILVSFDALKEWFEEDGFRGCMFIKAGAEYQDKDHPILLSYVDAVLQGYLREFGEAGAERFCATTEGWNTPVRNDRSNPVYPRAQKLSAAEQAFVDDMLLTLRAKVFA